MTIPKPYTVWITTNWKILRDGIPDHLTCLLEKPVCRSRSNRTGHVNSGLVQNWKRSTLRLYIVTLLIYLICKYIMQNVGLDEAQAGIKVAGRNTNNLRCADDTTLMAESKELKCLLMKVKEENEKAGLKTQHSKKRSWHLVSSLHGK